MHEAIVLRADDGSGAVLQRFGAHVTSWTTADGVEQLYLSRRATLAGPAAIRGGIPVIFPQFAAVGPLPKHGFARTACWEVAKLRADGAAPFAELVLQPSEATRAAWPHDCVVRLRAALAGGALAVTLAVENRGASDATFTAALHTYLRVDDADAARIHGLDGVRYLASSDEPAGVQAEAALAFLDGVNRIYTDVPRTVELRDGGRTVRSAMTGFADIVVWNPGAHGEAALGDMDAGDAGHMVCVEAAAIERPVHLRSGGTWTGRQRLSVR